MTKRYSILSLMLGVCLMLSTEIKADYNIYPIPQKMEYGTGSVQITNQVNVVCENGIDQYTKARLQEVLTEENGISLTYSTKAKTGMTNIMLGIRGSKGAVDKYASKLNLDQSVFGKAGKYDRHIVKLGADKKGQAEIIIYGEHTNAVFYGLATLEQMLEQATMANGQKALQAATVSDYADMQYRGIVEGYYGYPYSFDVKKDLMRFFKRYKMNTYLYGAKSDPYHSGFWRDNYPATISATQQKNGWLSQQMIRDLSQLGLETKVNFIWAIHPNSGKSVDYHTAESTQQAVDDVMGKFDLMHDLGIRQFAVFLDDAGWDFDDVNNYRDFLTNLQTTLENKYNKNYTNASDTVLPIHYVPHIYAINFARPNDLKTYFDAISQIKNNIVVYTTGSGVWSSLKNEDFVLMEKLMKRPVALWWNYPCNDNKDGRVYTADMYSTLHEMGLPTPDQEIPQCLGIVSNPMQQGTVAKICMFGVADYSWNSHAFNTMQSWKASFPAIIGKNDAANYNYLAQYLRYQDPESMKQMIDAYKTRFDQGNYEAGELLAELSKINDAVNKMKAIDTQNESNRLLLQDLKPWLTKLSKMTEVAQAFLSLPNITNQDAKWQKYCELVDALNEFKTNPDYMVDALEGMGENPPSELHRVEPSHKYLMPFIEWMEQNVYTLKDSENYEAKVTTTYNEKYPQMIVAAASKDGSYTIGKDNAPITIEALAAINNEKGKPTGEYLTRNITVILPKAGTIESATISDNLLKNFRVDYSLHNANEYTPIQSAKDLEGKQVKYLRFTNMTLQPQTITGDDFTIKMPSAPAIESATMPEGPVYEKHDASMLIDGNYNTFASLYRDQRDGDTYTVKLAKAQPVYDVTMALGTTNLDFPKVGVVQISADGTNWTSLPVEGTNITDMRMSMPQVRKLNDHVSLCSFKGNGEIAQYVRFVLKESFQEKWLRLNEIAINPQHLESQFVPVASVNSKPVAEVIDNKANTSYTPASDNETLVFNLFGNNQPSKIIIYAHGTGTASLSATDGKKTIELPPLKSGVNVVDLQDVKEIVTSISINIRNKSLSISEIVKEYSPFAKNYIGTGTPLLPTKKDIRK